jgi:hypothetical protein
MKKNLSLVDFWKSMQFTLAFALLLAVGSTGFYACNQKDNSIKPTLSTSKTEKEKSSRPSSNQLTIVEVGEQYKSTTEIVATEHVETVTFVRNETTYVREFYIKHDADYKVVELAFPTTIFGEANITSKQMGSVLFDDSSMLICAQFCRGWRHPALYIACRAACFIVNGNLND